MLAVPHRRLVLVNPAAFLPSDLSNLVAWYQFNKGITVTGAGVSRWYDQSGNGNHLLQGTDTNRPSKESDGSVLFDGVDNFLKADTFTFVQPETIYILVNQVSWTSTDVLYDGDAGTGGQLIQRGSSPQLGLNAGTLLSGTNGPLIGTYGVMSVVLNGGSSRLQLNKDTALTGNAGSNDMDGFTLAARPTGPDRFGNIQVKEVILYSGAHAADERTKVIDYLNQVGGGSVF